MPFKEFELDAKKRRKNPGSIALVFSYLFLLNRQCHTQGWGWGGAVYLKVMNHINIFFNYICNFCVVTFYLFVYCAVIGTLQHCLIGLVFFLIRCFGFWDLFFRFSNISLWSILSLIFIYCALIVFIFKWKLEDGIQILCILNLVFQDGHKSSDSVTITWI